MPKSILYFLIPVFNEEENIADLLETLAKAAESFPEYSSQFVLLNDGSTDKTVSLFNQYSKDFKIDSKVLSLDHNQGPGAAFRMGINHILPKIKDGDLVLTMEGDNTSKFDLIRLMLDRLLREDQDVILASPYCYGGGFRKTGFIRTVLSHAGNGMTKIFLNIHGIHTLSSFFRLHNYTALKSLEKSYGTSIFSRDGFDCMIEVLAKCTSLNLKISEVPMVVDWSKRKGKSKMKIVKTILSYFDLFLKAKKIVKPQTPI